MKALNFLPLATLALIGCAHGMSGGPEEEVSQSVSQAGNPLKTSAGKSGQATIAKAIAAEVFHRMPLVSDSKTLIYANTVGQYVAQELVPSLRCRADGASASDIRVAIVRSGTPSSFSLPGGLIFITTSLMQKMTTEDEFAGVLANEIVSSICEKGVPSDLVLQAATGWSDYVLTLPTKSLGRQELGFADKYALVTLYRRGYDIAPYVSFIAKNELSGRHMWGSDRAAVLKKSLDATPAITSTSAARASRFKDAKSKSI
jgi:hypothetical protein